MTDDPEVTTDPSIDAAVDPAPPVKASRWSSRRYGWGVLVPVVTASAGLMFAMSFQAAQGQDLRGDRDLPTLIVDGDARVAARAAELDKLEVEVQQLTEANAPKDKRLELLTTGTAGLAAQAAATPVSGPAIEVVLDDSKRSLDSLHGDYTADDIVVHQQDVQAVVNALWGSGAEAMMIQDQRIISTSAVRCVGNTLILQGRVYAPPYKIKAIGNVTSMRAGLDADPTLEIYQQYVAAVGLGWVVSTDQKATFPAYSGSVDLAHATPIR